MSIAIRAAAILALAAHALYGQGQISLFSAPSGTADPGTCRVPDIFYNSTGAQLKVCTAPNVWTALASGGTSSFSSLTGGTNAIPAHMTVGNGSILDFTGTGKVTASGWLLGSTTQGLEVTSDQCGLVGDGITDNYTNLKNCLTGVTFAIPARGLVLYLAPGVYNVDLAGGRTQIVIAKDNVKIRGSGGFTSTDLCHPASASGACFSNTVIRAVGSGWTGNYVLTWDGTGTTRKFLDGDGLEGIDIDGNNLAAGGVRLKYFNGASIQNSSIHDWVGTTTDSWGLDLTSGSVQAVGTCGQGGGLSVFHNLNIQSYQGSGANGIRLGDPATAANTDVCSMKFSNIFVANNNPPGNHSIAVTNADSNQFVNVQAAGFSGVGGTNTLLATSDTTATLTVPSHNMAPGTTNDGIFLVYVCTSNSFGGNNDCASPTLNVPGLQGTLTAAYISSTQIAISGAYGLTNGATYYVRGVHGADLQLGTTFTSNMLSQILTNYGVHNPGNTFNLVTGWNWGETVLQNPTYSRPGGNVFPVLGTDGSLWGMNVRTVLPFEPIGNWPNSLISVSSARAFATGNAPGSQQGRVGDFNAVINLTNAVAGPNGYYGLFLANNSSVGAARNGGGQLALMGVDTSNNLNIGTGGSFGAIQMGQGGLTTRLSGTYQFTGLTPSQCLALDGSSNVISQACGGGGGSAWASLSPGTNTTGGNFIFSNSALFSITGSSTMNMTGASGNTGKLQIYPDFSTAAAESSGIYMNMIFPGTRGTNNYNGVRIDVADTTGHSAPFQVQNHGNGDSYYSGNQGLGSGSMGSTSFATDLNYSTSGYNATAGVLPCIVNSGAGVGSGCELTSNPSLATRGLIIYDWSWSASTEFAVEVANVSGGVNAVARFANYGDNHMNLRFYAGKTSQQEEGICFDRYDTLSSPCLWFLGSTASGSVTQTPFHLEDRLNSRTLLSATTDPASRIFLDKGLQLPNGSGALKILDSGGTAVNVLSVSVLSGNSQTNFGSQTGGFQWFTGAGLKMSLTNAGVPVFASLPTSCAGQPTGAMWNNASVLNVCP